MILTLCMLMASFFTVTVPCRRQYVSIPKIKIMHDFGTFYRNICWLKLRPLLMTSLQNVFLFDHKRLSSALYIIFFENGQSTLKDYTLSKKGRIVKRLTIKHYQKFPLQLGILHIFMDAYVLPTLLSTQVSFITLSLKILFSLDPHKV